MKYGSFPVLLILCFAVFSVKAQDFEFNLDRGLTTEETYLQDAIIIMLIREQSRADGRDLKVSALNNIGSAIEQGLRVREILNALEHLALQGTQNRTFAQNINHPDIRSRAAIYLGEFGGQEAYSILIRMAMVERDSSVMVNVINSLRVIGINDNQSTLNIINRTMRHFDMFAPDNRLALSALEAYEVFAEQNNWRLDPASMEVLYQISTGRYLGSIRQRANTLLTRVRTFQRSGAH